jgi:hypothetical protein
MLEQPDLRPINDKEFELHTDYMRVWAEGNRLCRQTTRKGYKTDIASVPAIFAPLSFKNDGLCRADALLHDRRYQRRGMMSGDDLDGPYEEFDADLCRWVPVDRVFTRKECDQLFLKGMLEAGVSGWKARTMYYAVRIFGAHAW